MIEPGADGNGGDQWVVPRGWPTNRGTAAFWEELGRTIATFGMLEDVLARVFYVVSGQRQADPDEDPKIQMERWNKELRAGLSDTLEGITEKLRKEWKRENPELPDKKRDVLGKLKALSRMRNKMCHGAWIGFENEHMGILRFFPKGNEIARREPERISTDDMKGIRDRTTNMMNGLRLLVQEEYGQDLPGLR